MRHHGVAVNKMESGRAGATATRQDMLLHGTQIPIQLEKGAGATVLVRVTAGHESN